MPTPSEYITQIYAGYFNRAPDPEGLNYWVGQFNGGMSLLDIAQSFSVQPETTALYGFLTGGGSPASFLTSIHNNLLGCPVDAEGDAYWTAQLAAGKTVGRMIIDIISGAQGDDALLINNKVAGWQYFVSELERLNLAFDLNAAKNAYLDVNHLGVSITNAVAALDNALITLTSAIGSTFNVTSAIKSLTGTDSDDIFNAVVDSDAGSGETLTSGDTINSGGGTGDVLNILFDTASAVSFPNVNISNVEVINLRNISGKALMFNSAPIIADMVVNADRSPNDITITNLPVGAVVGMIGDDVVTNGRVKIGYEYTGGTSTVNLTGVKFSIFGGFKQISYTTSPDSVIVNSTLAANRISKLDVGAAAQSLTINASAPLEIVFGIADTNLNIITVTGSATNPDIETPAVYLGFPLVSTIDASGVTAGGAEVYLSAVNTPTTVLTGGQGNDILGGSSGSDTLTGGTGADRFEFYGDELAGTADTVLAGFDTITDFVVGVDQNAFSNVNEVNSAQQISIQNAVSALSPGSSSAQIAPVMATINTTDKAVSITVSGGNTYILYEATAAPTWWATMCSSSLQEFLTTSHSTPASPILKTSS